MSGSNHKNSKPSKIAIGCGSIFLFFILLSGLAGYSVFKVSKGAFSGIRQMTEIVTLDNNIVNQTEYKVPEDGLMSLEQVQALIYIQTEIKDALGEDYGDLILQYQNLAKQFEQAGEIERFRDLLATSSKLLNPLREAKRAQIEAINRESISKSEYIWLKQQAIHAFELPYQIVNLSKVLPDLKNSGIEPRPSETTFNPQNKTLLKGHQQLLTETLALTTIGL